jgi:hypothetical protein
MDADHEEAVGIERLARADHVVPPADIARIAFGLPGDMMRGIEGVTDQHRIGAIGIGRAVGLVHDVIGGQHRTGHCLQWLIDMQSPGRHGTD